MLRFFAQSTLAWWALKLEAEFARSVFSESERDAYEIAFDKSGLLRGDAETRWASHKIAIETGVLDADASRARGLESAPLWRLAGEGGVMAYTLSEVAEVSGLSKKHAQRIIEEAGYFVAPGRIHYCGVTTEGIAEPTGACLGDREAVLGALGFEVDPITRRAAWPRRGRDRRPRDT